MTFQAKGEVDVAAVPACQLEVGDVYVDRRGELLEVTGISSSMFGYLRVMTANLAEGRAYGIWEIRPLFHVVRLRGLEGTS